MGNGAETGYIPGADDLPLEFARVTSELWPGIQWKYRLCRSHLGWIDRNELPALPLEENDACNDILAGVVELNRTLNAVKGVTRVKLGDQFGIIQAADLCHCLLDHLPDGVPFSHIAVDLIGRAAVLGNVILDHLHVGGVVQAGAPHVADHNAFCVGGTTPSIEVICAE